MDTEMIRRNAMVFILLVAVSCACVAAQSTPIGGGVIYGAERSRFEKNFYTISIGTEMPTITLIANMTQSAVDDEDFPMQCFGYENADMTGPLNEFTPNALAADGSDRLFFGAWDVNNDVEEFSRLCFYSLFRRRFFFLQLLPDLLIGATFDQGTYNYVYMRESAPRPDGFLELVLIALDRVTARVLSRTVESMFVDATSGSGSELMQIRRTFRGGDMAIDCNRVMYASSVGTGGGNQMFFSVGLRDPGNETSQNVFRLISDAPDVVGGELTGFADGDQLAFDRLGRLISQDSARGIFSIVDIMTGANGELGVEGTDFVRFFDNGRLRVFTDLASSLDCAVASACVEVEIMSQCEIGASMMGLEPQSGGTIPCRPVPGACLVAPECVEQVDCIYYVREDQVPPTTVGLNSLFGK